MKGRVRADKILTAIVFVFIAFCVGSGIYFGVIGQARNCVMSFAYLLVVPVIYAVEYGVRLRFAPLFMAILLFLIAGGILGSAYDLYNYIPRFDEILHGISGVIFAVLGFSLMKRCSAKRRAIKVFSSVFSWGCCSACPSPSYGRCSNTPLMRFSASICRKIC